MDGEKMKTISSRKIHEVTLHPTSIVSNICISLDFIVIKVAMVKSRSISV